MHYNHAATDNDAEYEANIKILWCIKRTLLIYGLSHPTRTFIIVLSKL
jgi:hypothetical protein